MKALLNTLYITSSDSYLHRDGTNLVVQKGGEEIGRIPIHNIEQVVCFGYAGSSTGAMHLCAENNVTLTFLKPNGRFLASVNGEIKGNVLLRREQYRRADNSDKSLAIARNMIVGKIANCRAILRKGFANHPDMKDSDIITLSIDRLSSCIDAVYNSKSVEDLRGIEGDAAKEYFRGLNCIILKNKQAFFMDARTRRPPKDRFNALISFLYALLANDVKSALETVGLDPYVGFMHTDRPGRPSLALDLMEELRPFADRVAVRLINLGMIAADGFNEEEGGAYKMDDETRAVVIKEWQKTKTSELFHPFIEESVPIGMLPFVQSMLLARYLRNDIDGYPPFILKQVKK